MKNRKLLFIYVLLLLFSQLGISQQMGSDFASFFGFGFYINHIFLFLFYAIEYVTCSFIISFRSEYFFRQDGVISLLRYSSRKITYVRVIVRTAGVLLAYKAISYFFCAMISILRFHKLDGRKLLFAFGLNVLTSLLFLVFQVDLEIRFGPQTSIFMANAVYLAAIVVGSILYERAQTLEGPAKIVATALNRLIPYNYLYLTRVEELTTHMGLVAIVLLAVFSVSMAVGIWKVNNVDVVEKGNEYG